MPPHDRRRAARRRSEPTQPLRLHFDDSHALSEAFARAQQECWVDGCTADVTEGTLDVWLAPGVSAHPGNRAALRRRVARIGGTR